jgi:exonuclease SbcD
MKLLHTGDLHLGKAMHEASLLDDQRAMLDALTAELGRGDYDALVIAGDVYDRTVPPRRR